MPMWKEAIPMNRKRFALLMITLATSGMMGACSTESEPAPVETTTDVLMDGWVNADAESQEIICDGYYVDPEYSAYVLADTADVTVDDADMFLYTVC